VFTQWTVGWLLLVAAAAVFACGLVLRWYVGRAQATGRVSEVVLTVRKSALGRFIFGPLDDRDAAGRPRVALDGDELDQMIVMPTIILGAGLCLVAIFMLFFELVNR
jgi:hypothetical protein